MIGPDTAAATGDSITTRVAVSDTNGTVGRFVWKHRWGKADTTDRPLFTYCYNVNQTGADTITVYGIDDDGIESAVQRRIIDVHSYYPYVKMQPDTSAAIRDTLELRADGGIPTASS
jgi:hypothetical protein